jgi:GxxExxY protein
MNGCRRQFLSPTLSCGGSGTQSVSTAQCIQTGWARGGAKDAGPVPDSEKTLDGITGEIIDAAYRLHRNLGPGLLKSVYEVILAREFERRRLRATRQESVSFDYDGLHFRDCLRVDLLVESRVVVEIKSVERLLPVHPRQLLTYLRLMNLRVGLLINFGAPTLREGLQRIVNELPPSASPRLRVNHLASKTRR